MMRPNVQRALIVVSCLCALPSMNARTADNDKTDFEQVVAHAIEPAMQRYGVPGMAVGVVMKERKYVHGFGVATKTIEKPVSGNTLFEIGSESKAFTATLAAHAQVSGKLSLSDCASKYLPSLRDSNFERVSLVNLGTQTTGGLALQVPNGITNPNQLMTYFRKWKPAYTPGTYRTYSNLSIGMLEMIAATAMNDDFGALLDEKLFSALGMKHTYLDVPESQMENSAQGYTAQDIPVRMAPGILASETYGIRTTAGDMLRFIEANMGMLDLDERLQRAISTPTPDTTYSAG